MSYSNLFNLEQECPELEILIKTSLKIFSELSKYLRSFIKKKFLVYFFFLVKFRGSRFHEFFSSIWNWCYKQYFEL